MSRDPTRRFSNRVADYVRFRPSYPVSLIDALVREGALDATRTVADIGSGTGLLSRLFLDHGNRVVAVEPNNEMREAGAALLQGYERFRSVRGSAEQTSLDRSSVGLIVAGQAFHWFDAGKARAEFDRILEPGGAVALVWNNRVNGDNGIMDGYEKLVDTFGTDYRRIDHRRLTDGDFDAFFAPRGCESWELPNRQVLDHEGLRGRLLSCSYIPAVGEPSHDEVMRAVKSLFDRYQQGGKVVLRYTTKLYLGSIR